MGFNSIYPGKYITAHGSRENIINITPLTIEEAMTAAHEYLNKNHSIEKLYFRVWADDNGTIIEDYGSWSQYMYYIKTED